MRVERAYVDATGGAWSSAKAAAPLRCDRVLLAVGRVPDTAGLGLETIGIQLRQPAGSRSMRPGRPRPAACLPWATASAGPMLAHKASDEAAACVERIVTGYGHVNYDAIPAVVYTHPEIASVGKTERAAASRPALPIPQGHISVPRSGAGPHLGDTEGMVKVLADATPTACWESTFSAPGPAT